MSHCAIDFDVAAVPDEDYGVAFTGVLDGFEVDLGNQRAGGVYDVQSPGLGLLPDGRGDAVRGKDHDAAFRDIVDVFHEDGPFVPQFVHDVRVVHDFVSNVNGRLETLQA